ncbi:hypothetical protein GOP47_0025638 [Adiantum capillus-veneris]|uniref:C2 NT-type domain-containing protein n=1 Tax=Adiantum capillus-veneris TaxID=13818 RepID=A0A9D4Z350_ADICA|nr:hypothetical protein GOP47_0025638 [Adiantum capillus-veneris]
MLLIMERGNSASGSVIMPAPSTENFDFRLRFQASRVSNTACHYPEARMGQWPEPIIVRITQDSTSRGYAEKLYRLVVQMGSLRTGILGEATIDLTKYINSESPDTISLPLKKCTGGTVLHVKIQCITSKNSAREPPRQRNILSDEDDANSVSESDQDSYSSGEMAEGSVRSSATQSKSNRSYFPKSQRQLKAKRGITVPNTALTDGPVSMPTSRQDSFDYSSSSSVSNRGMQRDAIEEDYQTLSTFLPHKTSSIASQDLRHSPESFRSSFNDGTSSIKGWQDAYSWQADSINPMLLPSQSSQKSSRVSSTLSFKLDAAEVTIRELKEEVLTWETHAHKLDVEAETLRQQLASELKSGVELRLKLSSLESENDTLKAELAQLRTPEVAPSKWEDVNNYSNSELDKTKKMIQALEEEITYEREVHASLYLQLQKTQDSNNDLVSLVTELEAGLELRDKEISALVDLKKELENEFGKLQCSNVNVAREAIDPKERTDSEINNDLSEILEDLRKEMQDENVDRRVNHNELTDANVELLQKLHKANRQLDANVKLIALLEASVEKFSRSEPVVKSRNTWNDKQDFVDDLRMQVEKQKKQDYIDDLRMQVKKLGHRNNLLECQLIEAKNEIASLAVEFQALEDQKGHSQERVNELESQVPLLLEEIGLHKACAADWESSKLQLEMEITEMQEKLCEAQDEDRAANKRLNELVQESTALRTALDTQLVEQNILQSRVLQLETEKEELQAQVAHLEHENEIESQVPVLFEEIKLLTASAADLQSSKLHLEMEIAEMEEKLREAQVESRAANKKLNDLVQEMGALSTKLDAQLVAQSTLQSRALQHETEKEELQAQVAHLQHKNELESQGPALLEEIKVLKASNADLQSSKLQLEKEIAEMQEKIREAHDGERAANNRLNELVREMAVLSTMLDTQLVEWSTLQSRALKLETEKEELQAQAAHLEQENELESQVPFLLEEIKLLKASAADLQSSNLQLEMEIAEMQEKLREAHDENRAANQRLNELVQEMGALSTALDTQLVAKSTLQSRNLQLETEKEELQARIAHQHEVGSRVPALLEEMKLLKASTANLQSSKLQLEMGIAKMQEKLCKAHDHNRDANERLNESVQQMAALSTTLDAQLVTQSTLQSRAMQLEAKKEELQAQVAHLEEENTQLFERISNVEAELSYVLEERELLKADMETIHKKGLQELEEDHQIKLGAYEERSEQTDLQQTLFQEDKGCIFVQCVSDEFCLNEEISSDNELLSDIQQPLQEAKHESSLLKEKCFFLEAEGSEQRVEGDVQVQTNQTRTSRIEPYRSINEHTYKAEEVKSQLQNGSDVAIPLSQGSFQGLTERTVSTFDGWEDKFGEALSVATKLHTGQVELQHCIKSLRQNLIDAEDQMFVFLNERKEDETEGQEGWKNFAQKTSQKLHADEALSLQSSIPQSNEQAFSHWSPELVELKLQIGNMRNAVDQMFYIISILNQSLQAALGDLQQEKSNAVERLAQVTMELDNVKQEKSLLMEKLSNFSSLTEAQIQDRDQGDQLLYQKHVSHIQQMLAKQEEDNLDLEKRAVFLEEKLQEKEDSLFRAEEQLRELKTSSSVRSSIVSKEVMELRQQLKLLEEQARDKLTIAKIDFMHRETELCGRIEHLELSNEQLVAGLNITHPTDHMNDDQLKKELLRLQTQNASLARKEQELQSSLQMQEFLQEEVLRLQEANEVLEARLAKCMELAADPLLLEKFITLEIELAEAMDVNNLYRLQLKGLLDKPKNIDMDALKELLPNEMERLRSKLEFYKARMEELDEERKDMNERYSHLSLKLAETEIDRGELLITIKNLRNGKTI